MNSYLVGLIWKTSLILGAAWMVAQLRPRASAASRHLVWMTGFLAAALLPVGMALAPEWSASLPVAVQAIAVKVNASAPAAAQWQQWVVWMWMGGIGVMMLRLLAGHWMAGRTVRKAVEIDRRDGVAILESAYSVTPFCWGFLHPVVVLPADAVQWAGEMRSNAVAHEMAHIRRGDCWWQLLANLVCCFYWFQPLAWIGARRSTQEREQACDDAVLAAGVASSDYAEHLVAVARLSVPAPALAAAMVRGSGLERRIRMILDTRSNRGSANRGEMIAYAVTALLLLVPLTAIRAQDEIYKIGNGVSAPKLLHKVEPKYDPDARAAGVEGTTVLSVVVTARGEPRDIQVQRSLHPGLDAQGVAAVEQWLFEPARKDGKPVAVRATVEINFKLL